MEALNPISLLIGNIMKFISGLAGTAFTIAFIIYGFKLATSSGNPAARANAVTGLWFTALGAIISFGAPFIISMLQGIANDVSASLSMLMLL